jgi:hypothetical protein
MQAAAREGSPTHPSRRSKIMNRKYAALFVWAIVFAVCPAVAQDNFFPFSVDQDKLTGAPDFSFLNHPLEASDRVFVRDGHFYRVGRDLKPNTADDERVRLFGLNLAFGGNFPTEADAQRIAKRLRRLGVNLVRLHHLDSNPDANPENANSTLTTGAYPTLNPVSIRRLRVFLNALRAEGIYANLNLKIGYQFRPDVDRIPSMPENMEIPFQSKPLHMFYPRMVELQVEYATKLIRALELKGDPVLAMVEINNESSMLEAWQRGQMQRFVLGAYQAELQKQWNAFRHARGRSGEDIPLVAAADAAVDPKLTDEFLLFLTESDRNYLGKMMGAVRATTDSLTPVTGTQMGYGGLLNLDSHAQMDYLDNHFYIDHYNFPHKSWDARDWRIRDSSAVGTGLSAYLNMAIARQAGRPYTVSEFNQPYPNRQAAEIDPEFAAFAAFQDWDGLIHFAYSHSHSWDHSLPGGFDINGDWQKFASFGQSAWLFRSGAIKSGKTLIEIPVSADLQLQAGREKRNGNIAAFLNSVAAYDPAVALLHRVALVKKTATELPSAAKGPLASPFRSDTGELGYDRDQKIFVIDTPQAAGVFGFLGTDRAVTAGACDVRLQPGSRGFAAILVTALDGKPLRESARMLLSTPGYTLATLAGTDPPRRPRLVPYPGTTDWWTFEPDPAFPDKPSGGRNAAAPVWMERVESVVTVHSTARTITVYPLDGAGARRAPLPASAVEAVSGGFRIHLQGEGQEFSPWYEIVGRKP